MEWDVNALTAVTTLVVTLCVCTASAVAFLWARDARWEKRIQASDNEHRQKLSDTKREFAAQLSEGPPWLKPLMEANQKLMTQAISNAQIAIDVSKQHGEEMLTLSKRMIALEEKQDTVIEMMGEVCRRK